MQPRFTLIGIASFWEKFVDIPDEIFREILRESNLSDIEMVSLYIASASNPTMRRRLNPHFLAALNSCTPKTLFWIVQSIRTTHSSLYGALKTAWEKALPQEMALWEKVLPQELAFMVCYAFFTADINTLDLDKMLKVAAKLREKHAGLSAIHRVIKAIITALIYKRDFEKIDKLKETESYDIGDIPKHNYFRISRGNHDGRIMTSIAFPGTSTSTATTFYNFINLSSAFLANVFFERKNLGEFFILENAILRDCVFQAISFDDIVIRSANLTDARFIKMRTDNLDVTGADLSGAKFISPRPLSCLTLDYIAIKTLSNPDDIQFTKRKIVLPLKLDLVTLSVLLDKLNGLGQHLDKGNFIALQSDLAKALCERLAQLDQDSVEIEPIYKLAYHHDFFNSGKAYDDNSYDNFSNYFYSFFVKVEEKSAAQFILEQGYQKIIADRSSRIKPKDA